MPESHWKGVISFGLVSIPVVLYPAKNKNAEISFHQIDKTNHARIQYQRINSVTGKKVPWENIMKGYEYDKETIIPVPDDVLKKMAGQKSRSINIENFITKNELNLLTLENVYYLVPDKAGKKGYVILRNALTETDKVGIAKVVISTREYLACILPHKNALMLCLLRYHNEIKKPDEFELPDTDISVHKIKPKEIQVAKLLIKSMTVKWHPEKYVDDYKKSIHQWIKEAAHHQPHKKMTKMRRKLASKANMMDLLKQSLTSERKKIHKHKTTHHRIVH